MWRKVFREVEGEAFLDKIIVTAELTEGFSPRVFGKMGQTYMLYWSVQIV